MEWQSELFLEVDKERSWSYWFLAIGKKNLSKVTSVSRDKLCFVKDEVAILYLWSSRSTYCKNSLSGSLYKFLIYC